MVELSNPVGAPISRRYLQTVVEAFQKIWPASCGRTVSVALVDRRASQRLNRQFRGVNAPTDVLSFPARDGRVAWPGDDTMLGEVVICYPLARQQAKEFGHSVQLEIAELLIHGLAHLAGLDHDTKKAARKMADFEAKIVTTVNRQAKKRKAKNEKRKTTVQNLKYFKF